MTKLIKSPHEYYELVEIRRLSEILSTSEVQRVVIPERVEKLQQSYRVKYHSREEIRVPGVLTVAILDGSYHLVDGQHRYIALFNLWKETDHSQEVCVNFVQVESLTAMEELFRIINDTVPVSDIPQGVRRKDVNQVVQYFTERYPTIFRNTKTGSVQRPNINRTLFEEKVAVLYQVYPSNLIEKLVELNRKLSNQTLMDFAVTRKDKRENLDTFRKKAIEKGGLFFGMYPKLECLDRLLNLPFVAPRQALNPALRQLIWNMFYPDQKEGECLFCNEKITIKTCHMAHDVAHARGGPETKENLYPCCGTCNLSMGQLTYEQFREKVEKMKRGGK